MVTEARGYVNVTNYPELLLNSEQPGVELTTTSWHDEAQVLTITKTKHDSKISGRLILHFDNFDCAHTLQNE